MAYQPISELNSHMRKSNSALGMRRKFKAPPKKNANGLTGSTDLWMSLLLVKLWVVYSEVLVADVLWSVEGREDVEHR